MTGRLGIKERSFRTIGSWAVLHIVHALRAVGQRWPIQSGAGRTERIAPYLSFEIVNALDLLYIPIGLVTAPLWMRKKRDGWDERFGHVQAMLGDTPRDPERVCVLLHAVSVGEVNALRALVPMLAEQCEVVVSTTTDTGLGRARALFDSVAHVRVVRYPLDCSWMVRRFLDAADPDVVGLVELEVWPNFVSACVRRGIPIGIINGRLSERSFKGYKKIHPVLKPTFGRLRFACMQDERYASRISAMGVDPDRISVTGSMKWDSISVDDRPQISEQASAIASEMGIDLDRPIVVVGSSGPGEEIMMHRCVDEEVQLVIAPRKVERFDEAAEAIPGCVRRSTGQRGDGVNRFLLDTIGELSAAYELADLVIMGRSFNDQYGSDPTEPAALGKAVLIGPRHSDFQHAVTLLTESGGLVVVEPDALTGTVRDLLNDPRRREIMGTNARRCVRAQQGASQKHLDALMGQIER